MSDKDSVVADTSVEAAGAPELPSYMPITALCHDRPKALKSDDVLTLESAFMDWQADNEHILRCGGAGDVYALLLALNAALANSSISKSDASVAA